MIETHANALADEEERKFRAWMGNASFATLEKVAESRIKESVAQSVENALNAAYYPIKLDLANEDLRTAHRYFDFLKVLREIRDQDKPFIITTLS